MTYKYQFKLYLVNDKNEEKLVERAVCPDKNTLSANLAAYNSFREVDLTDPNSIQVWAKNNYWHCFRIMGTRPVSLFYRELMYDLPDATYLKIV